MREFAFLIKMAKLIKLIVLVFITSLAVPSLADGQNHIQRRNQKQEIGRKRVQADAPNKKKCMFEFLIHWPKHKNKLKYEFLFLFSIQKWNCIKNFDEFRQKKNWMNLTQWTFKYRMNALIRVSKNRHICPLFEYFESNMKWTELGNLV